MIQKELKRDALTTLKISEICLQQNTINAPKQTYDSSQEQLKQYKEFMQQFKEFLPQNKIGDLLAQKNIKYTEKIGQQDKQFAIKVVRTTKNWQAMILKLHYFNFETQISLILNENQKINLFEECEVFDHGGFSQVYLFKSKHNTIALKVMNLKRVKLKNVILQYLFNLIFDALKCGPSVSKQLGFDICIFNNLAFFSMMYHKNNSRKNHMDLFKQLNVLHSLKIIHGDIKPDNILYNHLHKKCVFCDFGLTKIIEQEFGKKTMTLFCGSLGYTSKQMLQLFKKNNSKNLPTKQPIDLYYNDFIGLKKSVQQFKTQIFDNIEQNQIIEELPFALQICRIKYHIFLHNQSANKQIEQHHKMHLTSFLMSIQPTQFLLKLVISLFGFSQGYKTCSQQENNLHKIYTSQGIMLEHWKQIQQRKKPNLIQFINVKESQKLSKMIQIREIRKLIQKQENNIHNLCKWYICYLNCWKEEQWSNAQEISQLVHAKIKLANKQVINIKSALSIEKVLNYNLQYCVDKFLQVKDVDSLLLVAYFFRDFIKSIDNSTRIILDACSLAIEIKLSKEIITQIILNTVFIILTPNKGIFMTEYSWISKMISKIITVSQLDQIRLQMIVYKQFLDQGVKQKQVQQISIPPIKVPLSNHFYKHYQAIRLCLICRGYMFQLRIKQTIYFLNQLQAKYQYFSQNIKENLQKFVQAVYMYIYMSYQNSKAVMILEKMTKQPKSYRAVWQQSNLNILIKKYIFSHQIQKAFKCFLWLNKTNLIFASKIFLFCQVLQWIVPALDNQKLAKLAQVYKDWVIQICQTQQSIYTYFFLLRIQNVLIRAKIIDNRSIDKVIMHIDQLLPSLSNQQKARLFYCKIQLYLHSVRFLKVISEYQQANQLLKLYPKIYFITSTIVWNTKQRINMALYLFENIKFYQHIQVAFQNSNFVNILQNTFHYIGDTGKYLQLFDMLLKQSYQNKKIEKGCIKQFGKSCRLYKHSKEMIAIANYYMKNKYYLSTNISLHNASYIIIYVVEQIAKAHRQKFLTLRKIALTIDTLDHTKKEVITKYYKIMAKLTFGRKKKWVTLNYVHSSQRKIKRKKQVINSINTSIIKHIYK